MPLRSQTWDHLTLLFKELPARRIRMLWLVLAGSFLQGAFDLLLIVLLARFVGLLAGSKLQDRLPAIYVFGGGVHDQVIWLVALLILSLWLASALRFAVTYLQSMLSVGIWKDFADQVYSNLLLQNYEFYKVARTSHLTERFNRILNRLADSVILPLIMIAGSLLSVLVLMAGVIVILGPQALLIFALMLAAYVASSRIILPYLRLASAQGLRFNRRVNQLLSESLRSIRDVQLYAAEGYFVNRFATEGKIGKRYARISKLLPDIPRLVIEPASITILFAIGLLPALISGHSGSIRQAVPSLVAILVTLLRISSPLQSLFRGLNKLRGGLPEIRDALDLLQIRPQRLTLSSSGVPSPEGIMPRRMIQLVDVAFRYESNQTCVLKNVNLAIPIGSRVALVGRTGSGKTTLAHLLLGLYQPSAGELLLDGLPVSDEEIPAWQANCAFVPQDIALLDSSIRQNVAFGHDPDAIDDDAVWAALNSAQLAEYVSAMTYGLYTQVGENGVRLSGGQRQRLALARAFYRNAKVLVLDEATSALDNQTEHHVMQALDLIGRRCTTIVIAHRLSTVKKCDRIYELQDGLIKASGDYETLCIRSETFRAMTGLANS